MTADRLRTWASRVHTSEAATELLLRAFGGRFAQPGGPMGSSLRATGGGSTSKRFQRQRPGAIGWGAAIVADRRIDRRWRHHRTTRRPRRGLDRHTLALVLAALSRAARTLEHSECLLAGEAIDAFTPRLSTTAARAKYRNLCRDPWSALHVTQDDFWAYVVLEDAVELAPIIASVDDPGVEEHIEHYRLVVREHEDWDVFRASLVGERRSMVRLRPSRAYGVALGATP